jgi:hypothetical protein
METDIEIEIEPYYPFYKKGVWDILHGFPIGNRYAYHDNDETICYFEVYYKGELHGPQYIFHDKLKELSEYYKFKYGKYHGTCISKAYKEYGWASDMMEIVIVNNDTLIKELKPRVVLD